MLGGHDIEQPGRLDLVGPVGQLPGRWARRTLGETFADGVVDLLDLGEEGVPVKREDVLGAPGCEVTSRPRRRGCELVAPVGVYPVPGGRSHDCCVLAVRRGPVLEPGLDDLDVIARQVDAGLSSEPVAGLDGRDEQPAAGQGQGGLSRSGSDLQDPVARLDEARDLEPFLLRDAVGDQDGLRVRVCSLTVPGAIARCPWSAVESLKL